MFSCYDDLIEGEYIMSHPAIINDERTIIAMRGDTLIESGSTYIPGESITMTLSDDSGQYAAEISPFPAVFEKGLCKGKRFIKEGGGRGPKKVMTVNIPHNMTSEVRVWAGWAERHGVVVITPVFLLVSPANEDADSDL